MEESRHNIFGVYLVIDSEGFRANVGIVLSNEAGQVFWAKRVGQDAWQFPQGGIQADESAEVAMFRELREEVGLLPKHVEIVGCTNDWLKYWLPEKFIRHNSIPLCIGQKQIWYLLKLVADETNVNLSHSKNPEFDHWEWIDYWSPARKVIDFKRNVYEQALNEFAPFLFP